MKKKDHRTYRRHRLKKDISLDFAYDVDVDVDISSKGNLGKPPDFKFKGLCKNISVEGMCLISDEKLKRGEKIDLDCHFSGGKKPVHLQGNVRWSKEVIDKLHNRYFETGIRLTTIEGRFVHRSVRFDKKFNIYWSDALELFTKQLKKVIEDKHM